MSKSEKHRVRFYVRWHDKNGRTSDVLHRNQHTAFMEGKFSKKFEKYTFDVMRLEQEFRNEKWEDLEWVAVSTVSLDGKIEHLT